MNSRGSGTEAVMKLAADKNGIKYKSISYVPGSEVRAGALLQGNIKASILDFDEPQDRHGARARKVRGAADRGRERHGRRAVREPRVPREERQGGRRARREHARRPCARSAPVRRRRRSCARSTSCCRTCRSSSRPTSSPTSRRRWRRRASRSAAAARRRRRPTSPSSTSPARSRAIPRRLKVEDFWEFGPLDRAKAKLGQ